MHCPQCGTQIESDEISYCTRCGQTLDRIRFAMSDEAIVEHGKEISRAGLNLGVVLMYAGLWPAVLTLILSPSAIPIAGIVLCIALFSIIFGSGPLLRLFQIDKIHPEIELARRREIAFGSTLMFVGSIIATLFVITGVPDSWAKIMLISTISAIFLGLLAISKPLYRSYRALTANVPKLQPATSDHEFSTTVLDDAAVQLRMPIGAQSQDASLLPGSITDRTTRQLNVAEED